MSKESIIARINALLSKTTENGCTEAEAAMAMHKAQQLMMQHAIESGELGLRAEKCEILRIPFNKTLEFLQTALAAWCGCKTYIGGSRTVAVFFGLPSDLQIVKYMYDYLAAVLDQEAAAYRKTADYAELRARGLSGISIGATFRMGVVMRIAERLREMTRAQEAQERQQTGVTTGTALVVIKNQVVNDQYAEYLRDNGLRMGKARRSNRSLSSADAYQAGRAAGDGVSLTRGGIGGGQRATNAAR